MSLGDCKSLGLSELTVKTIKFVLLQPELTY